MNITIEQLKAAMPGAGPFVLAYLPWLNSAMAESGINTKGRVARFLANLAHETGQLARVTENLNYSADGLANTWPSRYAKPDGKGGYMMEFGRKAPNELALSLHRLPQAIANNVYANRMGNGDEASGDGWRFRGAGGIQITGRKNHTAAAEHFRIRLEDSGDWLRSAEGVCRSAAWFWQKAGCNELADAGNDDAIADAINIGHRTIAIGDAIGFKERLAMTTNNLKVLT